jgi:hypothetical protein
MNMHVTLNRVLASIAMLFIGSTALPHHLGANDVMSGTPIVWHGTVSYVSWDGPHVMYRVDVKNANGSIETWQVLGGSPRNLGKRGILKTTVRAGDEVTIAGYLNIYSRIISPVYLSQSDEHKLFIGYFSSDEMFSPHTQTDTNEHRAL